MEYFSSFKYLQTFTEYHKTVGLRKIDLADVIYFPNGRTEIEIKQHNGKKYCKENERKLLRDMNFFSQVSSERQTHFRFNQK